MLNNCFEFSFLPQLKSKEGVVLGVDEVGRGALFGPVVASAVALPLFAIPDLKALGVRDSKDLSPSQRELLAEKIKAFTPNWAIASASVEEIDKFNILNASLLAMKRAILQLNFSPNLCLVDGNNSIPDLPFSQVSIIKGDSKSSLIAAASILAKVDRDHLIISLSEKYPQYDLQNNKGYGTPKHFLAIENYGLTPDHRRSFSYHKQLSLF